MFVRVLRPIRYFYHLYGYVLVITGEGLYTGQPWPLRNEGLLIGVNNYYDTGHPFMIMVIWFNLIWFDWTYFYCNTWSSNSAYPWHSHLSQGVWQWGCYCLFLRLISILSLQGIESQSPACGRTLNKYKKKRRNLQITDHEPPPSITWTPPFEWTCKSFLFVSNYSNKIMDKFLSPNTH